MARSIEQIIQDLASLTRETQLDAERTAAGMKTRARKMVACLAELEEEHMEFSSTGKIFSAARIVQSMSDSAKILGCVSEAVTDFITTGGSADLCEQCRRKVN